MKALALAPDNADARVTYGTVLFAHARAPERALREFKFAVRLGRQSRPWRTLTSG